LVEFVAIGAPPIRPCQAFYQPASFYFNLQGASMAELAEATEAFPTPTSSSADGGTLLAKMMPG
jgi:hypothetical protein